MFNLKAALLFARQMVGSPYVYGATGRLCTPSLRRAQIRQYPSAAAAITKNCLALSSGVSCSACRWNGRPAFDCATLVRFILKAGGLAAPSGASTLWKTARLWQYQGPFSPAFCQGHPCAVFRRQKPASPSRPMAHVGFSLGDGTFVDARGHRLGVVLSTLGAYPWTDLAIPQGMELAGLPGASSPSGSLSPVPEASPPVEPAPVLAMGSRGEKVRALQRALLARGLFLPLYGADGVFGQETMGALRAYQHMRGHPPTGAVSAELLKELGVHHGG